MSFTRKMLSAMGIEPEKIDQIMDAHTEVVDGLKKLAVEAKAEAEKVPDLEKKVQELEAAPKDDWKAKFDEEHEAFESYKCEVEAERSKRQKAELYRSLLNEVGIDQKRIDAVMKVTDIDALEVQDGVLADRDKHAETAKREWADFIVQTRTQGAQVDDPPAADPNAFEGLSLAEKMQYANEHPGDAAVKAWLGN